MASIKTGIELNDGFSQVIYSVINAVNMAVSSMEAMQRAMSADVDTSGLQAVHDEANSAMRALDELMQAIGTVNATSSSTPTITPQVEQPQTKPQPVQSNAPPGIDISKITAQINSLSSQIEDIAKANVGDEASVQMQTLQAQINKALQQQEELNSAMESGDISNITESYDQLNDTISRTQRFIQDNTDKQGRFNTEVQEGAGEADKLTSAITNMVGAYVSLKGAEMVIGISDALVSTTARLSQMNDGLQTTDELVTMVYNAAQDARGSFQSMADIVARFGNNAKDAFSSTEEVVAFANLIQKQMTIAGASTQEASNAMLQLSQALGSGVLRGDELNSIFEQAPNLIQSIANYLDVPIGQIRSMASEGQLSADVVKAAIFAAADDINAKFEDMPMTWGQIWQQMQNTALMSFQPVLNRLNSMANSDLFQGFVNSAINALALISNAVLTIFDLVGSVAQVISDNWSWIEPLIIGAATALGIYTGALIAYNTIEAISAGLKAASAFAAATHSAALALESGATFIATAAQYGFNAALAACPLTWIILLIIAVVAAIFAVCSAIAKMSSAATTGFGVITGGINVVIQFFKNLGLSVANIAIGIYNAIAALASNMQTAFHNAICNIQAWFYNLLSTAASVIAGIAQALNQLPFVSFDYSGITSAASDYASKAAAAEASKESYTDVGAAFSKGLSTYDTFQSGWVSDAFKSGAAWGDSVAGKISNLVSSFNTDTGALSDYDFSGAVADGIGSSGLGDSSGSTAGSASDIASSVDKSSEDLKYLRDIAEQETVNRYTLASVSVDMSGMTNHVNNGMDLDGVVSGLTDAVNEAIESMTEGVHD